MKAIHLVKNGDAESAFEVREIPRPEPGPGEVLVRVEGFGLNFADVMARLGLYQDAPPIPSVLGYDVAGHVEALGEGVTEPKKGDRVTAMTRFGGYSEYAITDARACAVIPETMDVGVATALATQYCTAWYAAEEMVRLHPWDHILVHAAAGGVGTAIVQIAKNRGCTVYGTAGSDAKLEYLKALGVDYPINYREEAFDEAVLKRSGGKKIDVIFDNIGGNYIKRGFKLLNSGGRIVSYGAASMADAKNVFQKIKVGLGFGIYHPVQFVMSSRSMLGVNMLRIADNRPEILQNTLNQVVKAVADGILKPHVGGTYPVADIASAHAFLESRKSMGKIVVTW